MTTDKIAKRDTIPILRKIDSLVKFEQGISIDQAAGSIDKEGNLVVSHHFIQSYQDQKEMKLNLDYIIELTSDLLNAKLPGDRIRMMVEDICEKYPYETFEDFVIVFKEIRQGRYKFYNNFSFPWICECITDYLDRKYHLREQLNRKFQIEKDKPILSEKIKSIHKEFLIKNYIDKK